MIRFIIVAITVIGFLILSIPILLIEWIIGKFSPKAKEISSLRIIQTVFKFILWEAGTNITVIGEENVPKDTTVLYIGNHRSYFDILLTYSRCPIRTGYIAKKEMERYPLLSNWMRYLHCLFLDRKDIKQGLKTILKRDYDDRLSEQREENRLLFLVQRFESSLADILKQHKCKCSEIYFESRDGVTYK